VVLPAYPALRWRFTDSKMNLVISSCSWPAILCVRDPDGCRTRLTVSTGLLQTQVTGLALFHIAFQSGFCHACSLRTSSRGSTFEADRIGAESRASPNSGFSGTIVPCPLLRPAIAASRFWFLHTSIWNDYFLGHVLDSAETQPVTAGLYSRQRTMDRTMAAGFGSSIIAAMPRADVLS